MHISSEVVLPHDVTTVGRHARGDRRLSQLLGHPHLDRRGRKGRDDRLQHPIPAPMPNRRAVQRSYRSGRANDVRRRAEIRDMKGKLVAIAQVSYARLA